MTIKFIYFFIWFVLAITLIKSWIVWHCRINNSYLHCLWMYNLFVLVSKQVTKKSIPSPTFHILPFLFCYQLQLEWPVHIFAIIWIHLVQWVVSKNIELWKFYGRLAMNFWSSWANETYYPIRHLDRIIRIYHISVPKLMTIYVTRSTGSARSSISKIIILGKLYQ